MIVKRSSRVRTIDTTDLNMNQNELSNEYLLAAIGVDTAENGPVKSKLG